MLTIPCTSCWRVTVNLRFHALQKGLYYSSFLLCWNSCTFWPKFFHGVVYAIPPLHNSRLIDRHYPIIFPNLVHWYCKYCSSMFLRNVTTHLTRYISTPEVKTFQRTNYVNYLIIFKRKCCFSCRSKSIIKCWWTHNDKQNVINSFRTSSSSQSSQWQPEFISLFWVLTCYPSSISSSNTKLPRTVEITQWNGQDTHKIAYFLIHTPHLALPLTSQHRRPNFCQQIARTSHHRWRIPRVETQWYMVPHNQCHLRDIHHTNKPTTRQRRPLCQMAVLTHHDASGSRSVGRTINFYVNVSCYIVFTNTHLFMSFTDRRISMLTISTYVQPRISNKGRE